MQFDLPSMLAQAQKMRNEMERVRGELSNKTAEGESGGGMVKAVVTCANKLTELKIAKEIVNPEDIEMLEDLVLAAVNNALAKAGETAEKELGSVAGMLPNIPGFNF